MPNFAELIAELCRTNCRTLYGRTTRDLLSNFAELIAELCTVRFGTVRPNFDPYSSAERRTSKIRVRPITMWSTSSRQQSTPIQDMKKIKAVVKTAIDQAKAHLLVAPRTVDNAQCIVNSRLNGRVAHKVQ